MMIRNEYTDVDRLRNYSSVFSRNVFSKIIEYGDLSRLDALIEKYDRNKCINTYFDYIKYLYRIIARNYRCEYVYKNVIINHLLLKTYGTKNTIAINEFRVQKSIVDIALFNGESKAFEIKTEYDTPKRLRHQIQDYTKLFQKCYIVIPEKCLRQYEICSPPTVGIIVLYESRGIRLRKVREAIVNKNIDVTVLMRSIRASEYKEIVMQYYGALPKVSCFDMFEKCQELISAIPATNLQHLFINVIKKRKNNTELLSKFPLEIRQMCLCMNLNQSHLLHLMQKLNHPITL